MFVLVRISNIHSWYVQRLKNTVLPLLLLSYLDITWYSCRVPSLTNCNHTNWIERAREKGRKGFDMQQGKKDLERPFYMPFRVVRYLQEFCTVTSRKRRDKQNPFFSCEQITICQIEFAFLRHDVAHLPSLSFTRSSIFKNEFICEM